MGELFIGLDVVVGLFTAGYLFKILLGELGLFKNIPSFVPEKQSLKNQQVFRRAC